jgi:hypothetical protein
MEVASQCRWSRMLAAISVTSSLPLATATTSVFAPSRGSLEREPRLMEFGLTRQA